MKIRIDSHSWKPLGHGVEVVAILRKILVARATTNVAHAVGNVEAPVDAELDGFSCLQRLGKVDAHHGLVDGHVEWLSGSILDREDLHVVVVRMPENAFQGAQRHFRGNAGFSHFRGIGIFASVILIQLQPKVSEYIRGVVDVGDRLLALDGLVGIV